MTLWFENSNGEWRPIAECAEKIDASIAIRQFINKCNENKPEDEKFVSYYTRRWESDGFIHYDVGSHTEFFHLQIDSNAKIPKVSMEE